MAGTAVTAAPATGVHANNGVTGVQNTRFTPKQLNDFRIAAVIDRLFIHLYTNSTNDKEFENLCLSLSRGIDFSIANHEVPNRSGELPSLIKKVCEIKNDATMQASIMVLMISIKIACQNGWFPDQDSEELSNLAKKVASNFCSATDFIVEPNPSHPVISTVMSRFFPKLRMGNIFVFLEVKPGFDAYVSDFHIPKNMKCSPGDRIRLFVVQTDNIETSSCLVTPPKVNFLLNGKGVERRMTFPLDTGPQVPTVVTSVLKYGSNLLQALGEFNGNYMIIVAFMSEVSYPDSNILQKCEQHALATVDADSEVIEGSSRISLNCPISKKRIRTPVKGLPCKHIQCFDFDNYVDMNSRNPYWRCPHCNQHVCFSDIRIDQKMVKILKEVGPKVSDIIISSDGSWNAVVGSIETTETAEDKTSNTAVNESQQPGDILDLTETDDLMDIVDISEIEDRKFPSIADAQTNQSSTSNPSDFWEGIYMSTLMSSSSNVRPNVPTTSPSASPSSDLTDPFTSTNRVAGAFHQNAVTTTSAPGTRSSLPNTLQYPQFGNSPIISDYGNLSAVPRHITRTASAVQALPAQTPASRLQRSSSTNGASPFTPNGLSPGSQASPAAPNLNTNRVSPHQGPSNSSSSPLLQHTTTQQNRPFSPARPTQQNSVFLDPIQVPNMYRVSNEYQNSNQPTNIRSPRAMSQSPGMIQPSTQSPTSLVHPHSHAQDRSQMIASANRTAQMSVGASRTVPSYSWNPDTNNMSIPNSIATPPSQPVTRTDSADAGWRPAGRMRGALSGQAYDDAYNRFIAQPSQQLSRPISNATTPLPNNVRPNLPSFMGGVNIPIQNSASAAPPGNNVPNSSSHMQ